MASQQRIPASRIGVLVIEHRFESRNRFVSYVTALSDFAVVGEASDVATGLLLAQELHPRVVVLGWTLQDGGVAEFLNTVRADPMPEVLVVASSTTDAAVREALTAGARGFIEETAGHADFTAAIRAVTEGRAYFGPVAAQAMRRIVARPDRVDPQSGLSVRERQVLALIAEGLSSKGIATQLGISSRTVEKHRASIGQRTGLRSIAQLTLFALRLGLIEQPMDGPFDLFSPDERHTRQPISV